jgi:hypothetical protein
VRATDSAWNFSWGRAPNDGRSMVFADGPWALSANRILQLTAIIMPWANDGRVVWSRRRITVKAKSASQGETIPTFSFEAGSFVGFVFMSRAVRVPPQGPSRPGSHAGVQNATSPPREGIPPQLSQPLEKAPSRPQWQRRSLSSVFCQTGSPVAVNSSERLLGP